MIFYRIRPQEVGMKGEIQNGGVVRDREGGDEVEGV